MLFSSKDHLLPYRCDSLHSTPTTKYSDQQLFDIDSFDACADSQDPTLMSTPFFNFIDPSGECSPDPFSINNYQEDSPQITDYTVHDTPSYNPAWQLWSNGGIDQTSHNQTQHYQTPPQQYYGSHGRAPSNSSEISYSPGSPYSRASSYQYPTTISHHSQQLAPSWNGYSSPAATAQHLPTPVHTPTSDTFMDVKSRRRRTSGSRADSALAAHRSMRSALTHQSSSGNINGLGNYSKAQGHVSYQSLVPTPFEAGNRDAPSPQPGNNGEIGLNFRDMLRYGNSLFDEPVVSRHVPKFDRTMSDIYQDELYNPSATTSMPTSAVTTTSMPAPQQPASTQQQQPKARLSPPHSLVTDRLNAAYLERTTSPGQPARGPSPFTQTSTYTLPHDNEASQVQPNTAAAMREQNKRKADAVAYAQHLTRDNAPQQQTVSPKDTFPQEQLPEEEQMSSLFPASSNQSGTSETTATYGPHNAEQPYDFNTSLPYSNEGFATPSVPASQLPNLTNMRNPRRRAHASCSDGGYSSLPTTSPPRLVSMETTNSESEEDSDDEVESVDRPTDSTTRAGTYTCTYHGCMERFGTPAELQKHKRDGHRSTGATGFGAAAVGSSSPTTATLMTQAGPHKCTRINPSTNKPCNTVFSRPYDLTRHEDTIHAERKKVRCPHCTEDKTFSRADALTRHLRVVHPHVSFPGKHRRRHD